jgi:hypothetical protein
MLDKRKTGGRGCQDVAGEMCISRHVYSAWAAPAGMAQTRCDNAKTLFSKFDRFCSQSYAPTA